MSVSKEQEGQKFEVQYLLLLTRLNGIWGMGYGCCRYQAGRKACLGLGLGLQMIHLHLYLHLHEWVGVTVGLR